MGRSEKRLAVLAVTAALAVATPSLISGQDPCSQSCPFINCSENVPPSCRDLGWCDCIYDYEYFYNAGACSYCAEGRGYYIIGSEWSPPCQYLCNDWTFIRQCLSC